MKTSYQIVEGAYLRDLLEQPEALRRTLAMLRASRKTRQEIGGLLKIGNLDRILLTGMGSSFHALHPLCLRLSQAGHFTQMMETSEAMYYSRVVFSPRTLTIAVSQSGESAEMVRLLREGIAQGPVLGITNSVGSTLATRANIAIVTEAGVESTVSCKTYLASLAALHWLGSVLLQEDSAAAIDDLVEVAAAVRAYVDDWQSHCEWMIDELAGIEQVFVTGRGWSLATAGTGGLILKESVRFAAEGMSSASFRHGPFELLSSRVLACICVGDPRTADLNRGLAADVRRAGGNVFLIGGEVPALRVGTRKPALLPLLEILPVQMLSLALAARRGDEAGKFSLATKITAVE